MKYLAIDYGDKHTGLAVCDPDETVASPLTVIDGQKDLLDKIARIATAENVEAIILGMPLNMDDSTGPRAKLVLEFAEQLKNRLQIPVHLQDERLTTFAAEDKIAPADLSRKKKKKRLDAIAAAQILETFLEQKGSK
jgi:putative Holliday junction resolvase